MAHDERPSPDDAGQRILCLGGKTQLCVASALAARPGSDAAVEVDSAATVDEALRLLAAGRYEAVIAEPNLLNSLLETSRRTEHDVVLDFLNEGVCVTDLSGHIQWSNRPLRNWGAELAEMVMRHAAGMARRLGAEPLKSNGRPVRSSLRERTQDGRHADIALTPILDGRGCVAKIMAVVSDRTAQVHLQQRIGAIEEAGRRLLHLEPAMVSRMTPDERLTMLQEQITSLTRHLLRFDHFRIRLIDPVTRKLELVLTEGLQETDEGRELFVEEVGSGISGYVAATGQSYICNDVANDPRYLPGLVDARSSLTVPLWHGDKVVGTFNVESNRVGAFGQQEQQALEIFSHYVGQALVTLQLLIAEKVSTTDQLARDVTGELGEPLGRIVAAARLLKSQYIGQDDEGHVAAIIDAVERIRSAVREVTDVARPIAGPRLPSATKESQPLDGRRILVADDEPTIRRTLSEVLSELGATVDLAGDGREAVAMGTECRYDLVLADIRMPHRNGYQVFAEIRAAQPEVPVILMTAFGYDPAHSVVKAREEGLKAVLFKPFKIQALYQHIGEALGIQTDLSAER